MSSPTLLTAFALTLELLAGGGLGSAPNAPTQRVEQEPVAITQPAPGVYLIDFGRVAFGNLTLKPPPGASGRVTVRFGEMLTSGRVETHPPGTVRYAETSASLTGGLSVVVAPAPDQRNTKPPAVLTPPEFGVLLPFRWAEITGWPGELLPRQVRRRAVFDSTWKDDAASFHSSGAMLDRIWELSHYTIKATTFAGVFVDGDRERISYEADAYLNQLSYYAGDADPEIARRTFDRLVQYPTWPTEWAPHDIFIAYADWMQTGDTAWLAARYDSLKGKLLLDRAGPDGLVQSSAAQMQRGDIVDWPQGERDGFVFEPVNTVVNAFHLRALEEMTALARALGRTKDTDEFAARESRTHAAFTEKLFDPKRGLYRDGIGTDHASLHANLFPLAFGLVPENQQTHVATWLAQQGMRCSPYAAQYLLEGMFEHGADEAAVALIAAAGDRSWRHMVESGATLTWEAWDLSYKPNQDWNHAWGAAPANLLPRFVLGIQPLSPGWARAEIQPHPSGLAFAEGKMPTPRGEITVAWRQGKRFTMTVTLPAGMTAKVEAPATAGSQGVTVAGKPVRATREGGWWVLEKDVSGSIEIEVR